MNEQRLIRRLQKRDERAFTELVTRFQGQIYNLCFRMLGNSAEAEDIAQETFVKCFRAIGTFRGESRLGTWLYRIAVNLCKNRLKYLGRRHYGRSSALDDVPEGVWSGASSSRPTLGEQAPNPEQALAGQRAESRVQRALASLEQEFRELLVLRDIQGLSYAEVVEVTGLAQGTVKSRLHRARAALRRAYDDLEASPTTEESEGGASKRGSEQR